MFKNKDGKSMAEVILLQLLEGESKNFSSDYKKSIRDYLVPMLERVDATITDAITKSISPSDTSEKLGDLVADFVKITAFTVSYAAAMLAKPELEARVALTDVMVNYFREEIEVRNMDFLKSELEAKARKEAMESKKGVN